jgi:hypothetical protein
MQSIIVRLFTVSIECVYLVLQWIYSNYDDLILPNQSRPKTVAFLFYFDETAEGCVHVDVQTIKPVLDVKQRFSELECNVPDSSE